jgi:hypothetical protein
MGAAKLSGRLKRLEGVYASERMAPAEREAVRRKRQAVLIFYRQGESREDALERTGINPAEWWKVEFSPWTAFREQYDDAMPEGAQWIPGNDPEEARRWEEALIEAEVKRQAS